MPDGKKPDPSLLPEKVRVVRPFGFIDENGRDRFWKAGTVVSGAEEIALLMERNALVEVV